MKKCGYNSAHQNSNENLYMSEYAFDFIALSAKQILVLWSRMKNRKCNLLPILFNFTLADDSSLIYLEKRTSGKCKSMASLDECKQMKNFLLSSYYTEYPHGCFTFSSPYSDDYTKVVYNKGGKGQRCSTSVPCFCSGKLKMHNLLHRKHIAYGTLRLFSNLM